jgi:hypothetical protein
VRIITLLPSALFGNAVFPYKIISFILIAAIALIGVLLDGESFAPPIGGALGALAGFTLSISSGLSNPSSGKKDFVYVKTSPYGGPVKQVSRVVTVFDESQHF